MFPLEIRYNIVLGILMRTSGEHILQHVPTVYGFNTNNGHMDLAHRRQKSCFSMYSVEISDFEVTNGIDFDVEASHERINRLDALNCSRECSVFQTADNDNGLNKIVHFSTVARLDQCGFIHRTLMRTPCLCL